MIRRLDFKLILIATLFSVILSIFVNPLITTISSFFIDIKINWLRIYFPLILAGIYIGFSAKESTFMSGAIVGIIYNLAHLLVRLVLKVDIANIGWLSVTYGPIKDGLLCGLLAWVTFTGLKHGLKNRSGNV